MASKAEIKDCCLKSDATIFSLTMENKDLVAEIVDLQKRLWGSEDDKHLAMREDADKIEELQETNAALIKELQESQSQCRFQVDTLVSQSAECVETVNKYKEERDRLFEKVCELEDELELKFEAERESQYEIDLLRKKVEELEKDNLKLRVRNDTYRLYCETKLILI